MPQYCHCLPAYFAILQGIHIRLVYLQALQHSPQKPHFYQSAAVVDL